MKTNKKYKLLNPIIPNWSISNQYRINLIKLTIKMTKDIIANIGNVYKKNENEITKILDSKSPVIDIFQEFKIIVNNWQFIYKKYASEYTRVFIDKTDKDVQKQINKSLIDFRVVEFNQQDKNTLYAKQSKIKENIDLIVDIPDKMKKQIQYALNTSIERGRDWKFLKSELLKIGNITNNRAKLIATDQIRKATSVISHCRQAEIGITENRWLYTNISKEPRLSHKHANGTIYEINKGCYIDGEYIYPAEKIGCKCTSAPIIKI
jgi:hypothetical protein